jgi:hypothetical protein
MGSDINKESGENPHFTGFSAFFAEGGFFDFPRPVLLQLEGGGQTRDTVSWKLGKMFAGSRPKMLPCAN